MRHVEECLALEPHLPLAPDEESRVMQFGKRIHADLRAVGQLHVDMLACRDGDRIARQQELVIHPRDIDTPCSRNDQDDRSVFEDFACPARQGQNLRLACRASGVGQHQHRIEQTALGKQFPAVGRITVDPVEDLFFLFYGRAPVKNRCSNSFSMT